MLPLQSLQLAGPEKLSGADDPRHALQANGVLADFWCLGDGDILCHPVLELPYLQVLDTASAKKSAERRQQ